MSTTLLVGVGGAGCHLAIECAKRTGLPVLAVNSDASALKRATASQQLLLEPRGGLPTSPLRPRMAAESSAPAFRKSIAGFDRVVLLAGLGGKTGTNALPSLANTARETGCDVLVAVTMPFSIETRRALAETALAGLRADGFHLVVHDHRAMEKLIPDGSMNNMIDAAAKAVAGAVTAWLSGEITI